MNLMMWLQNTEVISLWKVDSTLQSPCCITWVTKVLYMVVKATALGHPLAECLFVHTLLTCPIWTGMCYVMSYGILIQEGRYIPYYVFVLQLEVNSRTIRPAQDKSRTDTTQGTTPTPSTSKGKE